MKERWSPEVAWKWYESRPRPLGCNFIPSTAGNQLEMWTAESFDPATIARELDFAAELGMNALRVFLHDLAWTRDPEGFLGRVDRFLSLADARGLATMLVLFDDCWYEPGILGSRPEVRPGMHNSIWVKSPGLRAAKDAREGSRLEAYVSATVGAFSHDHRVLAWDVYNEVGNFFLPHLSAPSPLRQLKLIAAGLPFYLLPTPSLPLLRVAFSWVRAADPDQPLTTPLWFNHGALNRELLLLSDVVTFHNYQPALDLARQADELAGHGRPILCTEYLARTQGSRFETCLPVFESRDIGCFNWGLVSGRTQTIYSWADRGTSAEPSLWYHDILRADGSPFRGEEVDALRSAAARTSRS